MLTLDLKKIDELRQAKGLSWNGLAAASKIKGPSMHAIKTGKTKNVRATTLWAISAALGVSPADITRSTRGADIDDQIMGVVRQLDPKNKQILLGTAKLLLKQ